MLGYSSSGWVFGAGVGSAWMANDRFWYRNNIPDGTEYVLVDPAARTRARAFDHARLAAALSQAAESSYNAFHLPQLQLDPPNGGKPLTVDARLKTCSCPLQCYRSTARAPKPASPRHP